MSIDNILQFRRILDCVPAGIFAINLNREIIFFNKEAEKITGFERTEALKRKCYEIFRTKSCPLDCCIMKAQKKGREIVTAKSVILNKSAKRVPIRYSASLLRDENEVVIGWVEYFLDDSARVALENKIRESYKFDEIIGKDDKMLALFEILPVVAQSDSSILITGETGTGKDIFARSIHNASSRKRGVFVKVNCAALPEQLLESEMFGYKRGAFTDAKEDKAGRFSLANGGTIFLDEIGDLSTGLQAKLLQVVDEKEFFPLGATKPVKVNVRIIAATNRNLKRMVEEGTFRNDLYYRLKVIEINLPALRDRVSDIPLLVEHFLVELAGFLGKQIPRISHSAMKSLLKYHFPGNIRELKSILEYAMLLSVNHRIEVGDLPTNVLEHKEVFPLLQSPSLHGSAHDLLSVKEKEGILEALEDHGWNMLKTAGALNINRVTLWRKLKKHGVLDHRRHMKDVAFL
jgi:PAS domain S-box-containing protein